MGPRWWLGFLVELSPAVPLITTAVGFLCKGVWTPVYGIYWPPDWLYNLAAMIGTI